MPLIRPGIRRLFNIALRRVGTSPSDVDEEIALHLELRAHQLQAEGFSPDDAKAEAARRFGSTDAARDRLRAAAKHRDRKMDFREQLSSVAQDVRYAARGLVREPWFTAFVAITLGLGIGVNAAMYGVVDRLLLRGPEYVKDIDRLQNLYLTSQSDGRDADTSNYFGYVTYTAMRERASHMKVATFKRSPRSILFGSGENAELWDSAEATPDLFPLLGVTPLLGRWFSADEDRPSPSAFVVVLGYNVWKRVYNGDEKVIGKSITLSDKSYIVVGVARKGFTGPELGPVDVWMPATVRGSASRPDWATSWNWSGLHVIARLEPGVTAAQAATEATTAYRAAIGGRGSKSDRSSTLLLAPISYNTSAAERPEVRISRWLIGVCVIVLIVACSNVANLLLARAVRRRREVAVRLALGVNRARLLRLFLVESLMLSGIGAVMGLGVAFVTGTFMRKVLLPSIDWPTSVVGGRVLVVSLIVALVVGIAIGLLPAWRASRPDLTAALKSGIRDGGGNQARLRSALTIAQAALSVVLLVGAGLFVRSLSNVRSIDLGLETKRVMVSSLRWRSLGPNRSKEARELEATRQGTTYALLLARVRQLREVESASMTVGLPFQSVMSTDMRVPGWDSLPKIKSGSPSVSYIADDYFRTIGARILRGRAFTAADRKGSESVAIISQTMAKILWPNKEAMGSCFYASTDSLTPCSRIVGIVADAHRFELEEEPAMHYYLPWGQYENQGATSMLVRPRGDPNAAVAAIRRAALEVDPTISYVYAQSLQENVDPKMRPWKLGANIFVLMGLLALCVAAIGLYSVMSYLVAQRRQELGIRMALGASSRDILRLIMASGVGTAGIGVLLGVVAALLGGPLIQPLLFKTSPRDVGVFAAVVMSLLAVSILASVFPALRARRVNPIEALRTE